MTDERQEQPQSLSKLEAIGRLRQTIQRLETVVNQLDAESAPKLPSVATLDAIATDVENLAQTLDTPTTLPTATEDDFGDIAEPTATEETELEAELSLIDRILPTFDRVQNTWDWVIDQVRRILPATLNQRLSDWAITGILAATIVAVLSTSVVLTSLDDEPNPPEPPEIADISPLEPTIEEETNPTLETPPQSVEVPPEEVIVPEPPEVTTETEVAETPEIPETPATPPVVPAKPEPPVVVLTPEQRLVASVQNRVAQITEQYAEGLIDTVEANFLASRLSIKLAPDWYELSESRQNTIANQMWARSQTLDFSKLELLDTEGNLLARSPVVGEDMVIFKRLRR